MTTDFAPGVAMLERSAQQHPTRVAIETVGGQSLTYVELRAAVRGLAAKLKLAGVGPGSRVAIHLGRSAEHVVALFAVWCLGAVWVSIDPEQPSVRKNLQIRRSNATFLLTHSHLEGFDGITLDGALVQATEQGADERAPVAVDLASPAYVIWTSGSTGNPKGVLLSHEGLQCLVRSQVAAFSLTERDRVLWMLSVAFDAHLSDVLTTLAPGATLVIDPMPAARMAIEWNELLALHLITVCDVPPAVLRKHDPAKLALTVKTLVVGGEATDPAILRRWGRSARVISVYGPTENTVCTHLRRVTSDWDQRYLGDPIEGVIERVTEDGELILGGVSTALGYVDDPAQAEARFAQGPDGTRFFATRDRVHRTGHGLVFDSRLDRQAKIHGKLVAPEEVEAALRQVVVGVECVVYVRRNDATDEGQLCAALEGATESQLAIARELLAQRLPSHLCPTHWECVAKLPRTASGKVAVAEIAVNSEAIVTRSGDADPVLSVLRTVSGDPALQPQSDFFSHGGDSIGALTVSSLLEREGIFVPAAILYQARTAAGVTAWLSQQDREHRSITPSESTATLDAHAQRYANSLIDGRLCGSHDTDPKHIVVIGATGLVGSALARSLIERRQSLVLLARAQSDAEAQTRVERSLQAQGLAAVDPSLVRCFAVDPSKARWGWNESAYHALAARTRLTVNCTGRVHLFGSQADLTDDNVLSALDALEFAANSQTKSLIHLSTLSVAVSSSTTPQRCSDSWNLDPSASMHGGYAQSKYIAEQVIRSQSSVQCAIIRLGLVVGDTVRGYAGERDQLGVCLRVLARMGVFPSGLNGDLRCDASPVNVVAMALAQLTLNAHSDSNFTANCASRTGVTWGQWLSALKRVGVALEPLGNEQWFARLAALEQASTTVREKTEVMIARWSFVRAMNDCALPAASDLFAATGWSFESERIEQLLQEHALGSLECDNAVQDSIVKGALALRK